jgi:hypothetical protein
MFGRGASRGRALRRGEAMRGEGEWGNSTRGVEVIGNWGVGVATCHVHTLFAHTHKLARGHSPTRKQTCTNIFLSPLSAPPSTPFATPPPCTRTTHGCSRLLRPTHPVQMCTAFLNRSGGCEEHFNATCACPHVRRCFAPLLEGRRVPLLSYRLTPDPAGTAMVTPPPPPFPRTHGATPGHMPHRNRSSSPSRTCVAAFGLTA